MCARLQAATGIYTTGGHTPTYRRLFAVEPIRTTIRGRYFAGVPFAGLSAGALLAQETCIFPPEFYDLTQLEIVPGLGLLPGRVIEVHYNEPQRVIRLRENMARLKLPGIGIEDSGCALFLNETFSEMVCGSASFVAYDPEYQPPVIQQKEGNPS